MVDFIKATVEVNSHSNPAQDDTEQDDTGERISESVVKEHFAIHIKIVIKIV